MFQVEEGRSGTKLEPGDFPEVNLLSFLPSGLNSCSFVITY